MKREDLQQFSSLLIAAHEISNAYFHLKKAADSTTQYPEFRSEIHQVQGAVDRLNYQLSQAVKDLDFRFEKEEGWETWLEKQMREGKIKDG